MIDIAPIRPMNLAALDLNLLIGKAPRRSRAAAHRGRVSLPVPTLTLQISEADVLDCAAGAVVLTIDGVIPAGGDGRAIARSLGRIAREFARRYPTCDLLEEIEAQVTFPLPPGRAATVELPPGSPFRFALLLSMLAHRPEQTGERAVRAAAAGALSEAVRLCDALAIDRIAAPLLTGGWRIPASDAMRLMLTTLAALSIRRPLEIAICILGEPGVASAMRDLARTMRLALS